MGLMAPHIPTSPLAEMVLCTRPEILLATIPLKGLALGELENVLFLVCLWHAPIMPRAAPTEPHFQTTITQSHQIHTE